MPIPSSSVRPDLDDVKAHLNDTNGVDDVELQSMLDAACALVEQYIGPLDVQSVTESHFGVLTDRPIWLRKFPVLSVESVTSPTAPLSAGNYVLDASAGVLRVPVNMSLAGLGWGSAHYCDVTVSYTVGRASLEPPIRLAIIEVVRDIWSGTQSGGAGAARYGQDVQEPATTSGRPALPPYAFGLLEPYLLPKPIA